MQAGTWRPGSFWDEPSVSCGRCLGLLLCAQEGEDSFLTDKLQGVLKADKQPCADHDMDSLLQQLLATQAEWMRQQGRTPTSQDIQRLERAARDRRSTVAKITQLVTAED